MVAQEYFPWLTERILGGKVVRFGSLDELPPEAVRGLESLRKFGPKANVTFPLVAEGKVFGGLAFGTLQMERHWTDDLVARLSLVADVFASTLARKRSEESLHKALDEVHRLKDQLQREVIYLQKEVQALHGHDVRHLQSLSRRIAHFHTPDALREQFERDGDAAGERLAQVPTTTAPSFAHTKPRQMPPSSGPIPCSAP
jgi:GAF domain-containing protein